MTHKMPDCLSDRLLSFAIDEPTGISRQAEPLCFGFPIKKGEIPEGTEMELIDAESGDVLVCSDVRSTARWSDGSCRWLLVNAVVGVSVGAQKRLAIALRSSISPQVKKAILAGSAIRSASVNQVMLLENSASILYQNSSIKMNIGFRIYVEDVGSEKHYFSFGQLKTLHSKSWFISKHSCTAIVELAADIPLHLTLTLTAYLEPLMTKIEVQAHNPAAARHKNGLWDLGESNSIAFKEIGFELDSEEHNVRSVQIHEVDTADVKIFDEFKSLKLNQFSSGGVNDQSKVHIDKSGLLPISKSGYELILDEKLELTGKRCTPTFVLECPGSSIRIHPLNFWQAFPSAVRIDAGKISLAQYASYDQGMYELQPGECTSKAFFLRAGAKGESSVGWQPLELKHVERGSVDIDRSVLEHSIDPVTELDRRLMGFICGPEEFLRKREVIDEYGWRNFGEVFADHESLYVEEGMSPLVSHYNNQYDLIMGFGLQFMRTHDARWLYLMDDLAKHVVEIDTYKTDQDRVEYNNGLFWHTNHYECAHTATHRTFSTENYDPNRPYGSSGGPGAEHCYTTGLALHYFLKGEQRSADAVISLAQWMDSHMNGSFSLIGRLHSIVKTEVPRIIKIAKGMHVSTARYPFTRGTGNYLRACLDAFAVSGDHQWLEKADFIVINTFHVEDDIESRNLHDIEGTWFYTIFLQEVVRYLIVKIELNQLDVPYHHAGVSFIRYSEWMLQHAEPYLNTPESLEFVNDTWAAQDIRRYFLLKCAAGICADKADDFEDKAQIFADHISEKFIESSTWKFTRIQAILLQNLCKAPLVIDASKQPNINGIGSRIKVSVSQEILTICDKLQSGIRGFQLRNELNWLRSRL